MSIERTQSSQSNNASREVDQSRDRPRDKTREPEREQVDRFRTLMQSRGEGKEQRLDPRLERETGALAQAEGQTDTGNNQAVTDQAVQRKGNDDGNSDSSQQQAGGDALPPAELAALLQAQVLAREVPVALPSATPHANPQALADMLERHVRQLAIGPHAGEDKGQILLRLADSTLPGTDLLLSRTESGWLLRADVRSRGSYEAIQQAAPQLAERFAARNLGTLEVDPHFHG